MRGRDGILIALVVAGGGIAALHAIGSAPGAGPTEAAATCAKYAAPLADYLAASQRLGTIDARDQVDESRWSALSHDLKIQLALAAFCHDTPAGAGLVDLTGRHDGRVEAHVVDGNYFDD